jgi:3-dehydroquinate dehydratase
MRLPVFHGFNLDLLGTREPQVCGRTKLAEIDAEPAQIAADAGATLHSAQSKQEAW